MKGVMKNAGDTALAAMILVLFGTLGSTSLTESPGRTAVYTVPGESPPGGNLPFTYRPDTPLSQRSDGRFETSVSVVGLEQAG